MDENLEWLTQNTEDQKSNCKVIKKWQRPPFLHQPPPFTGLSPLSSKKIRTTPSDSIFGRPKPPFNKRGKGVPTI